jgi:hypothetical protein
MNLNVFSLVLVMLTFMACAKQPLENMIPDPELFEEESTVLTADVSILSASPDPFEGTYSTVYDSDTIQWFRIHEFDGTTYPYASSHAGTLSALDSIQGYMDVYSNDTLLINIGFDNVLYTYSWQDDSTLMMTNLEFGVTVKCQKWQ